MTALPTDTLLLTGFEPFGGDELNPSGEIARALDGREIDGARVAGVVLPCAFGDALEALDDALARHRPAAVLALGQADGRVDCSIERVAINVDDARMPDNRGRRPIDRPVVDGGPAAYFSTLPIKALRAGLRAAGFPASISQTAGTFVCNHVFYGLQHRLAGRGVPGGFMHVPLLPQQAAAGGGGVASLPLALQVDAVALALAIIRRWGGAADLAEAAGATH